MSLRLACLFALGVAACAHQPQVRERPVLELRDLCTHPAGRSLCKPVAPEAPRVDTNLASPPAPHRLLVG